MSTTTELLTQLIDTNTDIVEYVQGQYDRDLAKYDGLASDVEQIIRHEFYIASNGDDDAAGTDDAPLQTIAEAVRRSAHGGVLQIFLQTDYVWVERPVLRSARLQVESDDVEIPRNITFAASVNDERTRGPGFEREPGLTSMVFKNVNITLRELAEHVTFKPVFLTRGLLTTLFTNVEFSLAADADQVLFSNGFGGSQIFVENSTVPVEMGGHWVHDIVAGTLPSEVTEVVTATNLETL